MDSISIDTKSLFTLCEVECYIKGFAILSIDFAGMVREFLTKKFSKQEGDVKALVQECTNLLLRKAGGIVAESDLAERNLKKNRLPW